LSSIHKKKHAKEFILKKIIVQKEFAVIKNSEQEEKYFKNVDPRSTVQKKQFSNVLKKILFQKKENVLKEFALNSHLTLKQNNGRRLINQKKELSIVKNIT